MAELAASFPAVELTPDDFESFPNQLREKINATGRPAGNPEQWLLIGAHSRRQMLIMRRVL